MSSDGQGHIIINCQECNKRLITLDVGKATFHDGMSIRCTTCECFGKDRSERGGTAF